jgi:hypothetical protein
MQPIALGPDKFICMNPGTLAIFMNVNNRECDVYLFALVIANSVPTLF